MLKLSIFTPSNNLQFLSDLADSIISQTYQNWEWIILLNGKIDVEMTINDPRIKIKTTQTIGNVGALKSEAAGFCVGDVLVEVDHDDLLAPNALEEIAKAFETERFQGVPDFVYSDCALFEIDEKGVWKSKVYDSSYGWSNYPARFKNKMLLAQHQPPVTHHTIRRIEWSPNHVRAWRTSKYWEIGGHNPEMTFGDDHDLLVRTYLSGANMVHIPKCLYFQRMYPNSSYRQNVETVQAATKAVYLRNIETLALKFARDNALGAVDLGGGEAPTTHEGQFLSADLKTGIDLDKPWPFDDNSIGVLRAQDSLEHLRDHVHVMNEAYRVLAPGGFFLIEVPSTDGRGAFQDPTHVSFWNTNSFWYYTDWQFAELVSTIKCKFQTIHVENYFPTSWHQLHNIVYTRIHLCALKPGYKPYGEVKWKPEQLSAKVSLGTKTEDANAADENPILVEL